MKLSDLSKRMIITILIIATVSTLGSVIYHRSLDFLPFLNGAVIGSAVSITKVILLEHAVNKALKMDQKPAGNYVTLQHVLRLFLSGAAFLIGALVPQISLWGVVAGILAFQVAVYNIKSAAKI